jgi:hypothetical protein
LVASPKKTNNLREKEAKCELTVCETEFSFLVSKVFSLINSE